MKRVRKLFRVTGLPIMVMQYNSTVSNLVGGFKTVKLGASHQDLCSLNFCFQLPRRMQILSTCFHPVWFYRPYVLYYTSNGGTVTKVLLFHITVNS
jgi:hypothetical protein